MHSQLILLLHTYRFQPDITNAVCILYITTESVMLFCCDGTVNPPPTMKETLT